MKKPKLEELTLREKIGQICMVQAAHLMKMEDMEGFLKENPIGGVWHTCNQSMEATNLTEAPIDKPEDSTYYRNWTKTYTAALKVPPLIAFDAPLSSSATDIPTVVTNPVVGAANDDELAYLSGKYRALCARALGANWIWGPEVDIACRFNPTSAMRSCSDDLEKLCRISTQIVKGIQDHGVAATAKHFPGKHQVEYRDSHFAPTFNHSTLEEWRNLQAKSFKHLINNGVCGIMTTHSAFPASDDRRLGGGTYIPSTISKKTITGLLREEAGFDGVAITDSIDMASLRVAYPNISDLYVEIINAGQDIILNIPDMDCIDRIEKAINEGRISMERLDESCRRILDMKEKIGLFDENREEIKMTPELKAEVRAFNKRASEKAIVLECDIDNQLPLDASKIKNVAIVCSTHNEAIFDGIDAMKAAFEKRGMNVTKVRRILSDAEMEKIDAENDELTFKAE